MEQKPSLLDPQLVGRRERESWDGVAGMQAWRKLITQRTVTIKEFFVYFILDQSYYWSEPKGDALGDDQSTNPYGGWGGEEDGSQQGHKSKSDTHRLNIMSLYMVMLPKRCHHTKYSLDQDNVTDLMTSVRVRRKTQCRRSIPATPTINISTNNQQEERMFGLPTLPQGVG